MRKIKILAAAFGALSVAVLGTAAQAQNYPDRPVTMIVPWAPGGAADIIARLVAEPMGKLLGQPVVIENGLAPVARSARPWSRRRTRMATQS